MFVMKLHLTVRLSYVGPRVHSCGFPKPCQPASDHWQLQLPFQSDLELIADTVGLLMALQLVDD